LKSLINRFLAGVDILGCLCISQQHRYLYIREPKDRTNPSPIHHHHRAPIPYKIRCGITEIGETTTGVSTPTRTGNKAAAKSMDRIPTSQDDMDLRSRGKERSFGAYQGRKISIQVRQMDGSPVHTRERSPGTRELGERADVVMSDERTGLIDEKVELYYVSVRIKG
jgi:hypothetical protein